MYADEGLAMQLSTLPKSCVAGLISHSSGDCTGSVGTCSKVCLHRDRADQKHQFTADADGWSIAKGTCTMRCEAFEVTAGPAAEALPWWAVCHIQQRCIQHSDKSVYFCWCFMPVTMLSHCFHSVLKASYNLSMVY